ncbi:OstA-like protein [Marinoscillum sp. MHG1-6]|uniref:OstA-like protein n=1 Tax=Marinoscillum sp. MHG1-6 TaxID=2959627 RepID=UPI00215895D2|nr:OstA-like protein [Marinoscillum sp. MHG1-6]
MFKLQYYIIPLIVFATTSIGYSQKKNDKIRYKADELELIKIDNEKVRKLNRNVIFTQENTTVYCDSSYYYKDTNIMEAYGHIRIVDKETTITSERLTYNGDTRIAYLRKNVIYRNEEHTLYTDFLDYDMDNEIAHYFNKGKLIDSTNTLTSKIGYFYSIQDYAIFWKNVFLDAPDYDLYTDTLRYQTQSKIAYTFGPTKIVKPDSSVLNAQKGEFRTKTDESEFKQGAIETPEYYMEGDQLYFDEANKYYKAIGHVVLTSKEDSVIIIGDEGYYDKEAGISKVYGNPLMKKPIDNDTLFLAADTLMALESEFDSLKRILAFHDVRLYKKGLSGISDSMAYFKKDSLLVFYHEPVMWNNKNQSEGDTIKLLIKNENLDQMLINTNAFLISEDTLKNYNQIKGRNQIAYFVKSKIEKMKVNGNGEMLYYSLEEGDSVLRGMNKVFCSHMELNFRDEKLVMFKVYVNPEANFIPPHELTPQIQRLEGFQWRIEEKPEIYDVVFYYDSTYVEPKTTPEIIEATIEEVIAPEENAPVENTPINEEPAIQPFEKPKQVPRLKEQTEGDVKNYKSGIQ